MNHDPIFASPLDDPERDLGRLRDGPSDEGSVSAPAALQSLSGGTVLITGGGSGLGAAICRNLARAGMHVVVSDVDLKRAEAVAAEIVASRGIAVAEHLDVTDDERARQVVDQVLSRWGRFDVLINNAGVDMTVPAEDLPVSDWDRILRVNLYGPFFLSRAVIPIMKRQRSGAIVNIASTAAKRTWPNASAYHASKWGLLGLSHALHAELRPVGVRVTAVIAGGMRTPFLLDRFPDLDPDLLQDPETVAATVRFVLSLPSESVIPEVMVMSCSETSWP
jgi:NAD(P)-dependent dehydrogenase (short-subunit alcohol dehydrogenase family)